MTEEKCSNDHKLERDFNEAFSTLELVNAPDLDVYLKVLMSVDEKTAQCLRSRLNHVAAEFIDADSALKVLISKNKYIDFDIRYLSENYHKVRNIHSKELKKVAVTCIVELINSTNSIFHTFRLISKYVSGSQNISENHLTEKYSDTNAKFVLACCEKDYSQIIVNLHCKLYKIFTLLDHSYDSNSLMITRFELDTCYIYKTKVLKSIKIIFYSETQKVVLSISMRKLTDSQIKQLIMYFDECGSYGCELEEYCNMNSKYEDNYFDDDDDDPMTFNYAETIKYARSSTKK